MLAQRRRRHVRRLAGFAAAGGEACGPIAGGEAVQAASTRASAATPAWASRNLAVPVAGAKSVTASTRPSLAASLAAITRGQ